MKKRKSRALGAFGIVALLAASLSVLPTTVAHAQNTYNIEISKGFFSQTLAAESMRFFPDRLTVHQGDTLRFTSEGFHTATLLPANVGAQGWVDDNATGLAAEWGFVIPDPDESVGSAKANNRVAFPTSFTCGAPGAPACSYDGSVNSGDEGVLNSGLPDGPMDFSVTVDAEPGDFFWVVCLIHTNMRMKVTVVPDTEAPSDPASIAEASEDLQAQDEDAAQALWNKMINKQSKHRAGGRTVHDAWVGFDTKHVALYGMFPAKLKIKKGQTVRYHFDQLFYELHTATFPTKQGLEIASQSFVPVCDPDGDGGAAPDNEPDAPPPAFCSDPTQLEFDIPAELVLPDGNGSYVGGDDFENSGALGVGGLGEAPWDVRFPKASKKKGFGYVCMIHPPMRGKVVVRR